MKLLFITAFLLGTVSPFSVKNSKKNPLPQQQPPAIVDRRSILRNAGAAGVAGATFFTTVGDSSSGGTPSAILPSVSRAHAIVYPAAKGGYKLGSPDSVVGREIRSFNELIYNFKNTALDGGLDATKLNEPSVPFIEFGEKLKNGEVAFVEFLAPHGEKAYVTFKAKKGEPEPTPIRIGQGYPTMSKDSWSSPDYVIRSVSNFGVPYKFSVPLLEKYKRVLVTKNN